MSGERTSSSPEWAALAAVAALGLLARLIVWAAFPNILWPDEIYQSLEQAHRAAFGYGVQPWEFRIGARSWLLPGALALVMRAAALAGGGANAYLGTIALLLSLLSLLPVLLAYRWARRDLGPVPALLAAFACAFWFELVFFAPKALSEVVAAHLLLLGLYLADGPQPSRRVLAAAGASLGLAVALRIHLAPAVAVAAAWTCGARVRERWAPFLAGMAPVVLAAGLLDAVTWRWPFQSYALSLWVNLGEGRSRMYGVLPWDTYARMLARVWSWALVPILLLAGLAARRRRPLAAAALVTLLVHSFVAHKEYRFAYPAVAAAAVLAALGLAELVARVAARAGDRARPFVAPLAGAAWLACSLGLAVGFRAGDVFLADAPGRSLWERLRSTSEAFELLREDPGICGLALVGVPWYYTPGYSSIHRPIPLFEVRSNPELAEAQGKADAFLGRPIRGTPLDPSAATRCWPDGLCLFRRSGGCAPPEGYDLNERLRSRGE